MCRCPAGPFPLQAASFGAVIQLSFLVMPLQPGVRDVCHVWVAAGVSVRGAGDLGIVEEPGGVSTWDFSC